jgi:hypothetical protein
MDTQEDEITSLKKLLSEAEDGLEIIAKGEEPFCPGSLATALQLRKVAREYLELLKANK